MEMSFSERIGRIDSLMEKEESELQAIQLQYNLLEGTVADLKEKIIAYGEGEKKYQKAIEQFKNIADTRSSDAKKYLEDTLNWALSQIPLKQRYKAELNESETSRNMKEIYITLVDLDTGRRRNIKHQTGTAIAQIVSFLMNVIVIKLSGATRIIVLDEVFSGLQDRDTIKMFGSILSSLAEKEGFQFFFVEHKSTLRDVEGISPIYLDIQKYEDGVIQVDTVDDIISPLSLVNQTFISNVNVVEDEELADDETLVTTERVIKNINVTDDDIDFSDFDDI